MARNNRLTKEEIQQDKFIELVLQSYAFLKDNVIAISISVAVVIVGTIGYVVYHQSSENKRAEAAAKFSEATETYQEAETNFLDTAAPPETDDTPEEEDVEVPQNNFQDAGEKLQSVFEKYPNTAVADKARYNYAKTLYWEGNYAAAREQFQRVLEKHQPENQIYALYAQKAVGNCYEQEGDYAKAIDAYQAREFPVTSQLPPEIRRFVIDNAKLSQARCYEKLNDLASAQTAYKEIIDEFRKTVEAEIERKSLELLDQAKTVVAAIEEPIELTSAKQLEMENLSYPAFVAYSDAILAYKVKKDIEGGLAPDSAVRKKIRNFEKVATSFIKNVRNARKAETEGQQSFALSNYNRVVEFETLGLNRNLYERALLHYDRITIDERKTNAK